MKVESVKYKGKELRERIVPKTFLHFLVDCYYQIKSDIFKQPTQYTVDLRSGVISFNRTPDDLSKLETTHSEIL